MSDTGRLLDRLPHDGAARLLHEVLELVPGRRVRARLVLRPDDPRLNPEGNLPAVLLVELMAQAGGLLMDEPEPAAPAGRSAPGGPRGALLAGIARLHLHGTARAGEALIVDCRLIARVGQAFRIEGEVSSGPRRLAHGRIHLRRAQPQGEAV